MDKEEENALIYSVYLKHCKESAPMDKKEFIKQITEEIKRLEE